MTEPITWREETRRLSELKPYSKNPRRISKIEFEKLKDRIRRLGYHTRIKIDIDNTMNDGHQKWKALQELGMFEVPVLAPNRKLTEEEFDEILIESNTHSGVWDTEILANNWEAPLLFEWNVDVPGLFDVEGEVEVLQGEDDEVAPDFNNQPISKHGDIWILGNHRLMCGDSTKIDDIDKLMAGAKVDMVYTDPPYGMFLSTDYTTFRDTKKVKSYSTSNKYEAVIGDNEDFKPELINTIFAAFNYCKEIFIFGADYFAELLPNKNKGSWIVWDKRAGIEDIQWSTSEFELCWSKSKHHRKIARVKWFGVQGMEQEFDCKRQHPTQKPILLASFFIKEFGKDCKVIADIYGGSGSTLLACEQLERQCYMMELSPHYCDIIIRRWEKLTDGKAELEKPK